MNVDVLIFLLIYFVIDLCYILCDYDCVYVVRFYLCIVDLYYISVLGCFIIKINFRGSCLYLFCEIVLVSV